MHLDFSSPPGVIQTTMKNVNEYNSVWAPQSKYIESFSSSEPMWQERSLEDISFEQTQKLKFELSKVLRRASGIEEDHRTQISETSNDELSGSSVLHDRPETEEGYTGHVTLQMGSNSGRQVWKPETLDATTSTTDFAGTIEDNRPCSRCSILEDHLQDYVRLYGRLTAQDSNSETEISDLDAIAQNERASGGISPKRTSVPLCEEYPSVSSNYRRRQAKLDCSEMGSFASPSAGSEHSELDSIIVESEANERIKSHYPDLPSSKPGCMHGLPYDSVRSKRRLSFRESALSQALREKSACCRLLKERVSMLETKLNTTQSSLQVTRKTLRFWRAKEARKFNKQPKVPVLTENPTKATLPRPLSTSYGSVYHKVNFLRKQNGALRRQVEILKYRLDSDVRTLWQTTETSRNNNNISPDQNVSEEISPSQLTVLKQRNSALLQQLNASRDAKQTVEEQRNALTVQLEKVLNALQASRQQEQQSKRAVQHLTLCLQKLEALLHQGDEELNAAESARSTLTQDSFGWQPVQSHRGIYESSRNLATHLKMYLERHVSVVKELQDKLQEASRQSNRRQGLIVELRTSLATARDEQRHLQAKLDSAVETTKQAKFAEERLHAEIESQRTRLKVALSEKHSLSEELQRYRKMSDDIEPGHHTSGVTPRGEWTERDFATLEKLKQNQLKRILLFVTNTLSTLACTALRDLQARSRHDSGVFEGDTMSDTSSLPSARSMAEAKSTAAAILGLSMDELDQLTSTLPPAEKHTRTPAVGGMCSTAAITQLIKLASAWPKRCATLISKTELAEALLQQTYENIMHEFGSVIRIMMIQAPAQSNK